MSTEVRTLNVAESSYLLAASGVDDPHQAEVVANRDRSGIGGECDRLVPPQVAPWTAARYQRGTYVEIPRADHLVFNGEALPVTMGHIDDWIARNHVLATA